MSSHCKEIIGNTYLFKMKEILPDSDQCFFYVGTRSHHCSVIKPCWQGVMGKCATIYLAVRSPWQGIQQHKNSRDHICRKTILQIGMQGRGCGDRALRQSRPYKPYRLSLTHDKISHQLLLP